MLFHPNKCLKLKFARGYAFPQSSDVLSIVDTKDGHCWVLVYRLQVCSLSDFTQLCKYLNCF